MFKDVANALSTSLRDITGMGAGDELTLTKEEALALAGAVNDAADFTDVLLPKAIGINIQYDTTDSNDYYGGPSLLESLYSHFSKWNLFHTVNLSPYQVPLTGNNTPWTLTQTDEDILGIFYRITPRVNTESNQCNFSWTNNVGATFVGRPVDYNRDVFLFVPRVELIEIANQSVSVIPDAGTFTNPNTFQFSAAAGTDTSHYVWKIGALVDPSPNNMINATNAEVWYRPLYASEQGTALAGAIISYGMTQVIGEGGNAQVEVEKLIADLLITTFNEPDAYNK